MRKLLFWFILVFAAVLAGWQIHLNSGKTSWGIYWLLRDTRQGTAVVTNDRVGKGGHGIRYNYQVSGQTFSGGSGRRYGQDEDTRINNARPGNELTVYFSESHPWFSSLYRPRQRDLIDELILEAIPLVGLSVGFGIANWKFRKRGRGRRMAGGTAWAASGHTKPSHTTTTGWEMSMDAVQSVGDVAPGEGDTETVSVDEVTVYQVTGADGREHTYHSLDEMPRQLRAQVEKAFADEGQAQEGGHRHDSHSPPHEDAAAAAQAIDRASLAALDEIPPETRHQFEEFAAPPKLGQKFTFKFRGPDGREHTYHALEELPPDVRAIYDRLINRDPHAKRGR